MEISDDDDELNETLKLFEDLQAIGSDDSHPFVLHVPIDALESISTESAKGAGSPVLIEYGFTVSLSNNFAAWDSQGRPQVFSDTMKRGLEQAVGLVFQDHWQRTYRASDNVPEIEVLDVMREHDEVETEKLVQEAKAILQKNRCNKQEISTYISTTFAGKVIQILAKSEMFKCKIMQKKCNEDFLERMESEQVGLVSLNTMTSAMCLRIQDAKTGNFPFKVDINLSHLLPVVACNGDDVFRMVTHNQCSSVLFAPSPASNQTYCIEIGAVFQDSKSGCWLAYLRQGMLFNISRYQFQAPKENGKVQVQDSFVYIHHLGIASRFGLSHVLLSSIMNNLNLTGDHANMESSNHDEDNLLVADWSEQDSNRGTIEMFKDLSRLSEETQNINRLEGVTKMDACAKVRPLVTRSRPRPISNGASHTFEIYINNFNILPGKEDAWMDHLLKLVSECYANSQEVGTLKVLEENQYQRGNGRPCCTQLEFTGSIDALYFCLIKLAGGIEQTDFKGFTVDLRKFSQNLRSMFKTGWKTDRGKPRTVRVFSSSKGKAQLFLIKIKKDKSQE